MTSPFMLNVGGVWIPLTGVQRGVTRKADRPMSQFLTLGGTRYVQLGARAPRTWSLTYSAKDQSALAWLAYAANGLAGDVWLLDRMAAQVNMLTPLTTYGLDSAQPTLAGPDGVAMRTFAAVDAFTRLVREGQWYHLSGWTTATAGATLGVLTVGAETPVNVLAPAGSGARRWSVAFMPDADCEVEFAVSIAAKTTALRLTESSVDSTPWLDGMDTPCKVAVTDPDASLLLYREGSPPMSDYTVTVLEVG